MGPYIVRRMALLLFVLFGITLLTFSLSFLFPGDPLVNLSGYQDMTVVQQIELEQKYHIDSGYITQYLAFLGRIFQGDLGISIIITGLFLNRSTGYFRPPWNWRHTL
ncbi:MAG: cationic peptide transport system permease protein [Phenylobacterium sp.]|jgi:cationic peptide transport system permease protein